MPSFIDRTGHVFGELLVISCKQRASRNPKQKTEWYCKCSCGEVGSYSSSNLTSGNSTCCLACRSEKQITHGRARRSFTDRTYTSWQSMKDRCDNSNNEHYKNYGERGITYHPSWTEFENFLSDLGERPKDHTLERVDVDKGYTPENCKWASRSEQSYNRRKDKRNTSGVEGVSYRKDTNKWVAYIDKNNTRIRLGCHATKEEAISVRRLKEIELYGKIKEN